MREEPIVHLPVFSLIAGAVGGLVRFESILVDGFYRKVQKDVFYFACPDVVSFDLGQRLTDVPCAEGSLVVGKINQGHLGVFIALERTPLHAYDHRLERLRRFSTRGLGGQHPAQDVFDDLQLLFDSLLPLLKCLDLLPEHSEIFLRLRRGRAAPERNHEKHSDQDPGDGLHHSCMKITGSPHRRNEEKRKRTFFLDQIDRVVWPEFMPRRARLVPVGSRQILP